MYSIDQVCEGVILYIKREVIPMLPDYAKWLMGAMVIHNAGNAVELLKSFGTIGESIGLYTSDGNVDVDCWSADLKQSMQEFCDGKMVVKIKFLEPMTFTANDIDCLKRYIKGDLR